MSDLQMAHGTEILVSTLMLNKFLQRQFHRAGRHLQSSRCVQNCIFKFSQNQHAASGVLLSSQVTVSNSHFVLLSFHRDTQKHTERKNKPSWTEWIYISQKKESDHVQRDKSNKSEWGLCITLAAVTMDHRLCASALSVVYYSED